eukprot:1781269-Rhodomonas_salina.4
MIKCKDKQRELQQQLQSIAQDMSFAGHFQPNPSAIRVFEAQNVAFASDLESPHDGHYKESVFPLDETASLRKDSADAWQMCVAVSVP